MPSWNDKNGKLSKFFACKSSGALQEFLEKIKSVESKYDCSVKVVKIGDKAARVECGSDTMKDHTVSKALDNAYNGIWDAYRGTSKQASFRDLIGSLSRAGARVTATPAAAAAARGAKNLASSGPQFVMDKLVRTPRDMLIGHGVYGRSVTNPGVNTRFRDGGFGRVHQLNKIQDELGSATLPLRPRGPRRSGLSPREIAAQRLNERQALLDGGVSDTFNKLDRSRGGGGIFRPADHMTTHNQAVRDLTGNTGMLRQLVTGSPLGLRGRTPLRYEMQRALQVGDHEYAAALGRRMKEINRNRAIAGTAGVGGAAGIGMYQASRDAKLDARNQPSSAPEWLQNIVNSASGVVSPFAPNWADTMRQNPWATAGVGGAAGLLGLYLLMARNSRNNQPRGGVWA
jgi:hypothetical protein